MGRKTYAVRGGGCWRVDRDVRSINAAAPQSKGCRVSDQRSLHDATLTQSRPREAGIGRPSSLSVSNAEGRNRPASLGMAMVGGVGQATTRAARLAKLVFRFWGDARCVAKEFHEAVALGFSRALLEKVSSRFNDANFFRDGRSNPLVQGHAVLFREALGGLLDGVRKH